MKLTSGAGDTELFQFGVVVARVALLAVLSSPQTRLALPGASLHRAVDRDRVDLQSEIQNCSCIGLTRIERYSDRHHLCVGESSLVLVRSLN